MPGARPDAWKIALDALSRRELSAAEIRRKLAARKCERTEIDRVVGLLLERGYVDDRRVAYNHASFRAEQGRRGPHRVRRELRARGLDPELVEGALEEAFADRTGLEAVRQAAGRLLGPAGPPRDGRARARLARRLVRDGFPQASVIEWLESLPEQQDCDDDIS